MHRLYARVSTVDGQDPETQMQALKAANGPNAAVYEERASAVGKRPVWERMLREAVAGDTIVVWKLDRAFRSVADAANTLRALEARGVAFKTLTEGFDTGTSGGKLMFNVLAAIAEFERDLIRERTRAGLRRARAAGAKIGWPKGRSRKGQGKGRKHGVPV